MAKIFIQKGYQNVQVFLGGWTAWSEAGYPMENGATQTTPDNSRKIQTIFEIGGSAFILIFTTIYLVFSRASLIGLLRKLFTHPVATFLFRIIIGAIFVYASIDKIVHPKEFSEIVQNYRMLPGQLIPLFSLLLPWIEFLAGSLLVLGIFRQSNSLIVIILLIIFSIAVFDASIRGISTSCGCFSTTGGSKAGWGLLLRDLALIFLGIQVFIGKQSFCSLDNIFRKK